MTIPTIIDDASRSGGAYRSMLSGDGDYADLRRSLQPRWALVWLDLMSNWILLVGSAVALGFAQRRLGGWWGVALLPVSILVVGILVHRIAMFVHEGVHFNMAPRRGLNDVLTNLAAGVLVLTDVRTYRPQHLAHHRYLGTTRDTEVTYTNPIGVRLLLRSVTGLTAVDALIRRQSRFPTDQPPFALAVPMSGLLLHIGVGAGSLAVGLWWVALAWAAGVFSLFPTFTTLRQALEHRSEDARADVDYLVVDQGAVTRMFTRSRLSGILGGVGFDHHLLHHWEPGVSYTRLPELGRHLLTMREPARIIELRNGTYLMTLRRLWQG